MSDIESKAREQGWAPLDEFRGDPDKWVDANTFVERGEKITPILKERMSKAEEKAAKAAEDAAAARAEMERLKQSTAEFREFQETILANTQKKHAEDMARLKAERKTAMSEGDLPAVADLEEQIENLQDLAIEAQQGGTPAQTVPDTSVWDNWVGKNDWYEKNPVLQALADGFANQLIPQFGEDRAGLLEEMEKRVKEAMPDAFENPKRNTQTVDGGDPVGGGGGGKTFDDLPSDAQAACLQWIEDIPGFTKEKYLATYQWDA